MTDQQMAVIHKIWTITGFASSWYNVPVDRLRAHLWDETTWDAEGTNTHELAPDGGVGLVQVEKGVHPFADDPAAYDIGVSAMWGAWYLAGLYRQAGNNWHQASVDYNGSGPAAEAYGNRIDQFIQDKPWLICCKAAGIQV